MFYTYIFLAAIVVLAVVEAQLAGQTFECFDGNKTIPICAERDQLNIACNNIDPNDQTALIACICNQKWMTLTIQYSHLHLIRAKLTKLDVAMSFETA
jgi:hypothetical protein